MPARISLPQKLQKRNLCTIVWTLKEKTNLGGSIDRRLEQLFEGQNLSTDFVTLVPEWYMVLLYKKMEVACRK